MDTTTIPGVEIVSTGTYALGSGDTTFTVKDLAAAVLASSDPTIVSPRIGLGHTDKRFDLDDLDGEPAFGSVKNMRLANDGHTIVGDLTDVPAWLADAMPSSFPGRSIEGGFNFHAPSGRDYDLVISNLKLLGTTWPGITSLDDLREVLDTNGPVLPEPVEADGGYTFSGGRSERFVCAKLADAPITASLDTGTIPRTFAADLEAGKVPGMTAAGLGDQKWWWARNVLAEEDGTLSIIADDDRGHLLRVPVVLAGEGLTYGQPTLVKEDFEPLRASGSVKGPRVLASWPSRRKTEARTMDVELDVLRRRLGLADDATEDAVTAALAAEPEDKPDPVPTAGPIPEGMALVDKDTLDELRNGAKAGSEVAARLAQQDRDNEITAAIGKGKFSVGRREHYEKSWDADPEGTKALIASLEPGLVPVGPELGTAGDGEADPQAEDAIVAEWETRLFPELARTTGEAD